jgi:hypothetical protein
MAQTIRDFFQQIQTRQFSRDFLFRLIGMDFGDVQPPINFNESELIYARTASLPGRDITNVEAKYMGMTFNLPGAVTYTGSNGYSIEWYCDEASDIRQKFENLSYLTFDDRTSTGFYDTPTRSSVITLAQLDPRLKQVAQYKLIGCSIRTVSPIEYQMADGTGALKTFTTTIAYHFYERVTNPPLSPPAAIA